MLPDPRDTPTVDVEEAGRWFGLGRSKAYEQARLYLRTGGAEGIPAIRFGRSIRVPTAGALALLGLQQDEEHVP